jgi:hypothetical protein
VRSACAEASVTRAFAPVEGVFGSGSGPDSEGDTLEPKDPAISIALLHISLTRIRGRSIVQGSFPTIEVAPPKIGEIVTAYGLEKPRYDGRVWDVNGAVSRGKVLAVYNRGRERGMPFAPQNVHRGWSFLCIGYRMKVTRQRHVTGRPLSAVELKNMQTPMNEFPGVSPIRR